MDLSSAGIWIITFLLLVSCGEPVRSNIKSVRFGTNLLSKGRSEKQPYVRGAKFGQGSHDRFQGRLLHQGVKVTAASSGSCKSVIWDDRVVVASRFEEDVSWMSAYLHPYLPYLVYSISGDEEATHRTVSNTGRESQAYVQYIVDYYECLPKYMVFIHAHRTSPHSPDILTDLKRLQWHKLKGFVSLSRPPRTSTFNFLDPDIHKPAEDDLTETAHWSQFAYEQNINIKAHWEELFQEEYGDIPELLRSPNCGQFAIPKEQILAHPKKFWQKQLNWMRSTSMDPFWAGLIYEHLWSYLLGAGTNYTQPEECTIMACDGAGKATVPLWGESSDPRNRSPSLT